MCCRYHQWSQGDTQNGWRQRIQSSLGRGGYGEGEHCKKHLVATVNCFLLHYHEGYIFSSNTAAA